MSSTAPSFFIENLGCSKNQVDAEIMIAALEGAGWTIAKSPETAGLIIVNSCGFIDSAKEESIEVAFGFRRAFPRIPLLMAGCLSQRYAEDLFRDMPELTGVFGNRAPARVPEIASELIAGRRAILVPTERGPIPRRGRLLSFPGSAYVKISEGCDSRCTFCAIPSIRGGLQSRSVEDVVAEVRELLSRGVFEITLVSQDFSAFGRDRTSGDRTSRDRNAAGESAALLRAISAIPGDFWIRPLYVYPENFPREILDICSTDPRLLPYFDLPFQHADATVLRRMGRPGDGAHYLSLVQEIREAIPDAVIRATLMVGFPGEGPAEYATLKAFQQRVELDWAGVFAFSPQEGTAAARLVGRYPMASERSASSRKRVLERAQRDITERRLSRFVGRTMSVLLEEPVTGEPLYLGRAWCHAPDVDGMVVLRTGDQPKDQLTPGMRVRARIVRVRGVDLEAVMEPLPVSPSREAGHAS